MAAGGQRPRLTDRVRLEVGETVDGDDAVPVLDEDGRADVLPAGAEVDARAVGEPRVVAEPHR